MAKGGSQSKAESKELDDLFKSFVKLSVAGKTLTDAEQKKMNTKACGKMVKDCWPKELVTIADAQIFPKHKVGPALPIDKFDVFITDCAFEWTKQKEAPKIKKGAAAAITDKEKDERVVANKEILVQKLKDGGPKITATKESATGGVGRMTDTSKYTGAHKERFDESGKGKGAEGRTDKDENTGYVGQYKGSGTYEKKK